MVLFAKNLNGSFSGRGATDVDAGLDIKVGVPVGFLPGMAQAAGEEARRRFEDKHPALIIKAWPSSIIILLSTGFDVL